MATKNFLLAAIAAPALLLAQSNNIDLFNFVMADAQLIAGVHVDSAKNSPFGQFVLSRIPASGMILNALETETGVDPRSDLTEVLAAWNGAPNANGHWLIAARGNLTPSIAAIEVNAQKNGGNVTRLPGVDLVTFSEQASMDHAPVSICVGLFTDGFTDVAGDCTTVQAAIQFGAMTGGAASPIALKARQLRAQQDLWFASVVPLSQLSGLLPAGAPPSGSVNPGMILNNNLFRAIQQVDGGVKFASSTAGPGAQFSAEVVMDSPQSATALLNVLNFIVGILQTNTGSGLAGGGLATLLGSMQASVNGSALNVSLDAPEATLEQLFEQLGQGNQPAGN